jgi:tryptophan-rich sensory protein
MTPPQPVSKNAPEVRRGRRWGVLFLWLAVVFVVSLAGTMVTMPKIPTWYAELAKPGFTPPNWIFGPVWTTLYVLMALSVWRIDNVADALERRRAMLLFALQLALNALWSPVFFGFEAPKLGLLVIIVLVAAIAATLAAFWRLDRIAGIMLVPYLAWSTYATALNAAIVALN